MQQAVESCGEIIQAQSKMALLASYLRTSYSSLTLFKGLCERAYVLICQNEHVIYFFRRPVGRPRATEKKLKKNSDYFLY